jgi:O-antigen/teichoic acid export membrane protein
MTFREFFLNTSILKGGAWLLLERVLLLLKGLLLAYIFANLVSREVYGGYQFVVAFLGLASVLVVPGMGIAIVQALARGSDGTFSRATRIMFRAAFFGSGMLLVSAGYYAFLAESNLSLVLFIFSVFFPVYAIANLWRYYYTGKERFDLLVKASVILESISLFSILVAIFFFNNFLGLILFGLLLPIPFSLILVWSLYRKSLGFQSDEDNIRFGKKVSYAVGLSTLVLHGDKLLLGHFLGFSELALYSVAMIVPEQAKGALASFMTPLLPRYSKDNNCDSLRRHIIFFSICSLLGVASLYFLLPIIFRIVFPLYSDGILFAQFYLLTLLFIPVTVLETFFRSQKDERAVFRATVAGGVTGLTLAFILVPLFGISGAIVARIGGLLFQGISFLISYVAPKFGLRLKRI